MVRPLVLGAFLRLENGDLTWVQFGYERVFKVCFKCGCVGHTLLYCPYSFEMALILERTQEGQQFPHSPFWKQNHRPHFTTDIRAYNNTNLNYPSRLEILWFELEIGAIETINSMGVRSVFFLRKDLFTSSSEVEGPFDPDVMEAAESDHAPTEPFTPAPTPPNAGGETPNPGDYDLQARKREECHFGLDEAFELELNTLGLTCLIDRPLRVRKH